MDVPVAYLPESERVARSAELVWALKERAIAIYQ